MYPGNRTPPDPEAGRQMSNMHAGWGKPFGPRWIGNALRGVVKLRELLRKVDLKLRPLQVGGRPQDNVDAMKIDASAAAPENVVGFGDSLAPTNWVPSQQDERPRH